MVDAPAPIPGAIQRDQRAGTGYAMVLGGAVLFAVNGTVSKVALTGSDLSAVDYTQIRTAGAFLVLALALAVLARDKLRIGLRDIPFFAFYGMFSFALVQWLYLVAIEHLPIGIALLIEFTRDRARRALGAGRHAGGRPAARVGRAQPHARRPRARLRALARLDARHGRRRRGRGRRDRAGDLPARGRARGRDPGPAHRPLLLAPLRGDRLVGRAAVVDVPVRGARPRRPRSSATSTICPRRSGRSRSGRSSSARSRRSR